MAYNPALDHLAVVKAARARYGSQEPSAERGWRIINEAALHLRDLGEDDVGLHRKTSGTNFDGYSIDVIGYRDSGLMIDALQDAEGSATPQWNTTTGTLAWAPPVGDTDPPDPPVTLASLDAQIKALMSLSQRHYDEHGWALGQIMQKLGI